MTWNQKANKSRAKPVTVRGKTYPSRGEAARQLGVTPQAIRWAMRNGSLDRIGLGTRYRVGDYNSPKRGDKQEGQRHALD